VLAVVSDAKLPAAKVLSHTDYYAFGGAMPGRSGGANYRYGFNTQEKSPELAPGHYTAEFWEYDARVGRRWNLDPVVKPHESGYGVFANNPLLFIDPDGRDIGLGNLYSKDKDGKYLYERQIRAFEAFASTKQGRAFITDRAQKGFRLQGAFVKDLSINVEKAGKLSKKIDANFQVTELDEHPLTKDNKTGADGLTEGKITDKGKLSLLYHMDNSEPDFFFQVPIEDKGWGKEVWGKSAS
jgi:RHS repeat-associated protein